MMTRPPLPHHHNPYLLPVTKATYGNLLLPLGVSSRMNSLANSLL